MDLQETEDRNQEPKKRTERMDGKGNFKRHIAEFVLCMKQKRSKKSKTQEDKTNKTQKRQNNKRRRQEENKKRHTEQENILQERGARVRRNKGRH